MQVRTAIWTGVYPVSPLKRPNSEIAALIWKFTRSSREALSRDRARLRGGGEGVVRNAGKW